MQKGKRISLFVMLITVFCMYNGHDVFAAGNEQNAVYTEIISEGNRVTLNVNLAENTMATSGRIKVSYPADLLKFLDAKNGKTWQVMDTDVSREENGERVVSYAWADTKECSGKETLLTVTMEASDKMNGQENIVGASDKAGGQEITVKTEIVELFSREEKIAVKNRHLLDRLTLTAGEKPSPTVTQNNSTVVRTGDSANLAGYALLCMGALVVMAEQVKKKMADK